MMLLEQSFKNVFVCSPMYQDRINRMPKYKWPEWLKQCHVISSIYCRADEGHHFDGKGTKNTVSLNQLEREFPNNPIHDREDDE